MRKFLLQILIISLITGCKNDKPDSERLTRISQSEKEEKYPYHLFSLDNNITYRNDKGDILPLDSVKSLTNWNKKWAQDLYENENGEIEEIVLRKPTKEDLELKKRIQEKLENKAKVNLRYVPIDCANLSVLLTQIDSADQEMRNSGIYDPEADKENLNLVINILNQCGMPNWEQVPRYQFSTIWLVIQHSSKEVRKTYFPILKQSAENGDLRKKDIAMMEDRMLMDYGKPQIYGTQVYRKSSSEPWKLYDLKNPEMVNIRRKEVGLEPLEQYLENFGIDYQIEQE
ncbi:hypothetical protein NE848_10695 [Gramella jeungdoensis]|uniref:Lipoprotein n=1 Tax=Gramella jeungdoensis TaxID=708091 RepID=A0ABT0Z3P4_9FLAO|nr:DUF6624 domain-containing protein [Gramella jeungdoensis]MCM8569850.1 hypothetical protein [Gramella jeungdoensis]